MTALMTFCVFLSLLVLSASPSCYDSHCKPEKRHSLHEDPCKVMLPKLGFGGIYHCKC